MAKVNKITDTSGAHAGWMIFCPACESGHLFDDRWTFNGDVEKPTFRASMLVHEHPYADTTKPRCHSFVTDGNIAYCSDSGHEYAGQTLELPDWNDVQDEECVPCNECTKTEGCKRRTQNVIGCTKGIRPQ